MQTPLSSPEARLANNQSFLFSESTVMLDALIEDIKSQSNLILVEDPITT